MTTKVKIEMEKKEHDVSIWSFLLLFFALKDFATLIDAFLGGRSFVSSLSLYIYIYIGGQRCVISR